LLTKTFLNLFFVDYFFIKKQENCPFRLRKMVEKRAALLRKVVLGQKSWKCGGITSRIAMPYRFSYSEFNSSTRFVQEWEKLIRLPEIRGEKYKNSE